RSGRGMAGIAAPLGACGPRRQAERRDTGQLCTPLAQVSSALPADRRHPARQGPTVPLVTAAIDAGPTEVPLLESTIGDDLRRRVAEHADQEALVSVHQGIRWTWTELGERVQRLARGLLGLGLQQGDRVGLWSPNYAEWTLVSTPPPRSA